MMASHCHHDSGANGQNSQSNFRQAPVTRQGSVKAKMAAAMPRAPSNPFFRATSFTRRTSSDDKPGKIFTSVQTIGHGTTDRQNVQLDTIRDEVLVKPSPDGSLASRRVVLTPDTLYFLKINEENVIDKIPLEEIEHVRKHTLVDSRMMQGVGTTGKLGRQATRTSCQDPAPDKNGSPHHRNSEVALPVSSSDLSAKHAATKPKAIEKENSGLGHIYAFQVETIENGFNSGRKYILGVETNEAECDSWIVDLHRVSADWQKKVQTRNYIRRAQARARRIYESWIMQCIVVGLVVANFAVIVMQAQMKPEQGTRWHKIFFYLDIGFTSVFTAEILFNLFGHFLWDFLNDGWSMFDLVVIICSVLQLVLSGLPGLSQLRVLRSLRLLRLFENLSGLRRIVGCIVQSIVPVLQTMCVAIAILFIYATIGVEYFGDVDEENFGSFSRATYSLFRVMAFQEWRDDSLPPFDVDGTPNYGTIFFVVTFVTVLVWVLLQVIVAVLLENFFQATAKDKEMIARNKAFKGKTSQHVLDPLMQALSQDFETPDDLGDRIDILFEVLDDEQKGKLTFDDLHIGLKKMTFEHKIHLSREDYKFMIGEAEDADRALFKQDFEQLIRKELLSYIQRKMADALALGTATTEVQAILTGLKLMLGVVGGQLSFVEGQNPANQNLPSSPAPIEPSNVLLDPANNSKWRRSRRDSFGRSIGMAIHGSNGTEHVKRGSDPDIENPKFSASGTRLTEIEESPVGIRHRANPVESEELRGLKAQVQEIKQTMDLMRSEIKAIRIDHQTSSSAQFVHVLRTDIKELKQLVLSNSGGLSGTLGNPVSSAPSTPIQPGGQWDMVITT